MESRWPDFDSLGPPRLAGRRKLAAGGVLEGDKHFGMLIEKHLVHFLAACEKRVLSFIAVVLVSSLQTKVFGLGCHQNGVMLARTWHDLVSSKHVSLSNSKGPSRVPLWLHQAV